MPTFDYQFEPPALDPVGGPSVELTTMEVENAGLKEVLQAPGVAFGNWSLFDALLVNPPTKFIFKEPLGLSREVKTALSGLFGRFIARAYAEKYLGFTHFETIARPLPMALSPEWAGAVDGLSKGDLPDWVAWNIDNKSLAIIEAKGSHHPSSPEQALTRAFDQATRAWISSSSASVKFKRFAIATRWGVENPGPTDPMLWVRDPDNDGEADPALLEALGIGVQRRHYAALLRGLGHRTLSKAILAIVNAQHEEGEAAKKQALELLESSPRARMESLGDQSLIGAYVTRGATLGSDLVLEADDIATLHKLGLRPALVAVSVGTLKGAIVGDSEVAEHQSLLTALVRDSETTVDRSGIAIERPVGHSSSIDGA